MQQKVLTFTVDGQCIRAPREKVVADSRNYLVAQFRFSEQWQGLLKTAVFQGANGEAYHMVLENDRCVIPPEVIIPTRFLVSVFGGDRLTADTAAVEVVASGYTAGGQPPTPTPDLYAQLLSSVETERQLAQAAAVTAGEKADLCKTDADMAGSHAVTASVAADDATAKANAAAFYAEQCALASDKAQTAIDTAEQLMDMLPDLAGGNACLQLIEQNNQVPTSIWVGTSEQAAALSPVPENTLIFKTDDDTAARLDAANAALSDVTASTIALDERVGQNERDIDALQTLDGRVKTAEQQLGEANYRISNAENNIGLLGTMVFTTHLVGSNSDNGTSLLNFCNNHPTPGIQVIHVGTGTTDAPAQSCLAFYACNSIANIRTLWLFSNTGNLHFCNYADGSWKAWRKVTGTTA